MAGRLVGLMEGARSAVVVCGSIGKAESWSLTGQIMAGSRDVQMYGPAGLIWQVRCQNSTRAHILGENGDSLQIGGLSFPSRRMATMRRNGDGKRRQW